MKKALHKEWLYGLRNHRFLIVFIGLFLLGALTPLMMAYVLPELLGQYMMNLTPEEISSIFDTSQTGMISTFLADLTEIGLLLICLVYAPIIPSEIHTKAIPFTRVLGISVPRMVVSKWLVFSLITMITGAFAIIVDYIYAGFIDHYDIPLSIILWNMIAFNLLSSWIIASLIWVGSWMKSHVASAMIVFFGTMLLNGLFNLLEIKNYTPLGLITLTQSLVASRWESWVFCIIASGLTISLMLIHTTHRLHRMEWVRSLGGTS